MASDMHNLSQLVGTIVTGVVVVDHENGLRRGFITLSDDTHVEIYMEPLRGGVSNRCPGGFRTVVERASNDRKATITGMWSQEGG